MKIYVISIGDRIKRTADTVNVHERNDTFQFVVSENLKTIQVHGPNKFCSRKELLLALTHSTLFPNT